MAENLFDIVKFDSAGLVPAVVQDAANGEVLMVAYMNRESLQKTLETGKATYWSRSRQKFWIKGESSGHFQFVKEMTADCDADCIVIKVDQVGAACHTGFRTCFYRRVDPKGNLEVIGEPAVKMSEG
jgi:phosphoribosyl-AMP cyclohydrolase